MRILIAAGSAAAGLLLGWLLWHTEPVREGAAAAAVLPGGAQVLERAPDATPPKDVRQAAREFGGQLERAVTVTVRPHPNPAPAPSAIPAAPTSSPEVPAAPAEAPALGCSCEPVSVDLGLVRMPDRTRRVVATARGGEIIGGIDIPLDAAAPARTLRWAAGATYEPRRREYGVFVDRDLGPLRLGLEVGQRDQGVAVVLRAGIRF